jgi:hypothetical protein
LDGLMLHGSIRRRAWSVPDFPLPENGKRPSSLPGHGRLLTRVLLLARQVSIADSCPAVSCAHATTRHRGAASPDLPDVRQTVQLPPDTAQPAITNGEHSLVSVVGFVVTVGSASVEHWG